MVSTRILIISDTHSLEFDSPRMPFGFPPPKVDIILHCGDLTKARKQTRKAYEGAIALLAAIPAELKLVIAGNHDIALDPIEWAARGGKAAFHNQMIQLMTGPTAKARGITFLNEGMHSFTLESGANFSVYATPYTPLYSTSAFKYEVKEDRFNLQEQISSEDGIVSVAKTPVPDWPGVDLMITHGPPYGVLDTCKKGTNAGCENLSRALGRARPRLHCFGHVHEGYGAKILKWEDRTTRPLSQDFGGKSRKENMYPESMRCEVGFGRETVVINAAVKGKHYLFDDDKLPWLIELDLFCGEAQKIDSLGLDGLVIGTDENLGEMRK
jgi:predicted phosphodiesterase